jgi:RimJ/RimL family protein N-acetyltransferase/SAM-dependent methyltransferase
MSNDKSILRPATLEDTQRIFEWRNDPWIVSLSTSRRTVTFEEHQQWMRKILGSQEHLLFVIVPEGGLGAGTARVEQHNHQAVITIYLLRQFTGQGLGVRAIREACAKAFAHWPVESIHAYIRGDNQPSLSAFSKAGFARADSSPDCPADHSEMVIDRKILADSYATQMREHYLPLLQRHGPTYQAVDWGSAQGQALRFRMLLEIGNVTAASLLDVGCGIGHLASHLKEINFRGNYIGFDLVPEMVQTASTLHPGWMFRADDLLATHDGPAVDYVVGSGLFTFASRAWLEQTVRQMFERCRIGVAFNSLSGWSENKQPGEFYADPTATLEFCRTLTPWVVLRHDYMPHDFTIYMYRRPRTQ